MSDLLLVLITVPTVAAFVGWITNWLAVKMIFYPERFVGVGPIGWQGILPRRAEKFATGVAETLTTRLISPREMAEKLDPAEMEQVFEGALDKQTAELCREAAEFVQPGAWAILPAPARGLVVEQVRLQSRQMARELWTELRGVSGEVLDLKKLVMSSLTGANTNKLVRLFQEIGRKELRFITYSGGIFGAVIGLAQVGVLQLMDRWWLMPIVGALVGLVTNWLAIKMVFRPQQPKRYLGVITYQGLFAKRQAEISRDYGRITADEVLTPRNLIRLVSEGEAGERIARLVTETISRRIDAEWKKVAPMVPVKVTPEALDRIKALIVRRLVEVVPEVQPQFEAYLARKLDIARTVEGKLAGMPKPEFERVLRGLFEEDEIILIVVGGVLGAAVGVGQAAWMLARGLA